jgi:SAM-dependent methyltransferase
MKALYCATYVTGFGEVVESALARDTSDYSLEWSGDGACVFESGSDYQTLRKLPYLNDVFVLLDTFPVNHGASSAKVANTLAKRLRIPGDKLKSTFPTATSFRLMVRQGSQLVGIPRNLSEQVNKSITSSTRWHHEPLKSDIEFWLIIRNEGIALFGARSVPAAGNGVHKGELSAPLSHLMVMLSQPSEDDTFLDPFAGYGAIPAARMTYPFQEIIAADHDPALFELLNRRIHGPQLRVLQLDATDMSDIPDGSITVIVTDPPWGHYREMVMDYAEFSRRFLSEFARVLKPGGRAIVLTAKKEQFPAAVSTTEHLTLERTLHVLVSGKKAGVFFLSRQR